MSFLQTLQVVLKHFIISIQVLDLPQRQLSVQAWVDLVKFEHFQSHLLDVKRPDYVFEFILTEHIGEVLCLLLDFLVE
jgi:hypothetical protein